MNREPLVSIGLPVYNGAKYLRECIDSVLVQTFPRFELIISDNASTDETAEICRAYSETDGRIKYVRQVENRGAKSNFEYVLQHSSCKYFMWIAADDKIAPTFVEELYAVMSGNPDFSLAMSDAVVINSAGETLAECRLDPIRVERGVKNWPAARSVFFRNPTSKIYFCIYGLYRREAVLRCELNYRGKVRYVEGLEIPFLAQVALTGKIGSVTGLLWFHRHHDGSSAIQSDRKATRWQRVDNMLNISSVIFVIARNAKLGGLSKLRIYWNIIWTLVKGLAGMTPGLGPLYRKVMSVLRD